MNITRRIKWVNKAYNIQRHAYQNYFYILNIFKPYAMPFLFKKIATQNSNYTALIVHSVWFVQSNLCNPEGNKWFGVFLIYDLI